MFLHEKRLARAKHPAFFSAQRSTRMSRNARRPTDRVPPRRRESAKTSVIPRRAHLASTALRLLNQLRHRGLRVALRNRRTHSHPNGAIHSLSLLCAPVWNARRRPPRRGRDRWQPPVPSQQGRALRQGLVGRGHARPPGTSDRAAGPGCWRRAAPGNVGDRDRDDRGSRARHSAVSRRGRGRRVRQRGVDQREGLSPRQVRPGRARHVQHRLQRALLHVLGRGRVGAGFRARSRSALPTGRHLHGPARCCSRAAIPARRCRR